jgi:hypothetical protein
VHGEYVRRLCRAVCVGRAVSALAATVVGPEHRTRSVYSTQVVEVRTSATTRLNTLHGNVPFLATSASIDAPPSCVHILVISVRMHEFRSTHFGYSGDEWWDEWRDGATIRGRSPHRGKNRVYDHSTLQCRYPRSRRSPLGRGGRATMGPVEISRRIALTPQRI